MINTETKQITMTPKEKALELVNKFHEIDRDTDYHNGITMQNAKQCALVAVNEILESQPRYPSEVDWDDCGATHQYYYEAQREEADKYWQEVKQEIEKL